MKRLVGALIGLALAAGALAQQDGAWSYNGGGLWSDVNMWQNGLIADGIGATASFSLDITADRNVTQDTSRVVGKLYFRDTSGGSSWFLRGIPAPAMLTLDNGAAVPSIEVYNNRLEVYDVQFGAANGFTKLGGGEIRFKNSLDNSGSLTGKISVLAGTLMFQTENSLGAAPSTPVADAIYLSNGGLKNLDDAQPVISANRGITIESNAYLTIGWRNGARQFQILSPITGPGNLNINYDGDFIVLANPANDYSGDTRTGGNGPAWYNDANAQSNLRLGAPEVIPDGPGKGNLILQHDGSTRLSRLDMNSFSETVNGLSGDAGARIYNSSGGAATLTVGNNDADGDYSGTIDGNLSIVKIGGGRQYLAGAMTIAGSARVEAGTLGFTAASNLTVYSGVGIGPGRVGEAATLTVYGGLALTNTTVDIDLTDSPTTGFGVNDFINVSGTLALSGVNTIRVTPLKPVLANNPYLVLAGGMLNGSLANLTATAPDTRYTMTMGNPFGAFITVTPSGSPKNITWVGNHGAVWDLNNTVNWVEGGAPEKFYLMDGVTFDDTSAQRTVDITGLLRPSAVTVNSASDYTLQGAGSIAGSTGLSKTGPGILTVSNTNTYSGATVVAGGILRITHEAAVGRVANSLYITNAGSFDVQGRVYQYKPFVISGVGHAGAGAIINTGGNQNNATRMITLAGDVVVGGTGRWDIRNVNGTASLSTGGNPYSYTKVGANQHNWVSVTAIDPALGHINILQGMLGIEGSTAPTLGDTNYSVNVFSGGTFQFWAFGGILQKPVVFHDGARWQIDSGGTEATQNRVGGPVLLSNGVATVDINSGVVLSLYQGLQGAGSLRFQDVGVLRLNENNVHTGETILQCTAEGGAMVLQSNGVISASSRIVLGGGRLLLDNTRVNLGDRIADAIPTAGQGGFLVLRCPTNDTGTEALGPVILERGVTTFRAENIGDSTPSTALFLGSMTYNGGSADFDGAGFGTLGGGPTNSYDPHIYIGGQADGVMPLATVGGTRFAVYSQANGVAPLVSVVQFDGGTDQATQHVVYDFNRVFESDFLTADRSIGSLVVDSPGPWRVIDLMGSRLHVESGGILVNGPDVFEIMDQAGGGRLTGYDLVLNVTTNVGTLKVHAAIWATNRLCKTGPGTLVLTADNTYPGETWIMAGTLRVGEYSYTGSIGTNNAFVNGTLTFSRLDSITVSNRFGGAGTIRQDGPGATLLLSGDSREFYGNVDVWTGIVRATHSYALGAWGTGTVNLAHQGSGNFGGRALELSGGITVSGKVLQTTGLGYDANTGILRSLDGTNAWLGPIQLLGGTGNTGIGADSGHLTIGGPVYSTYNTARGFNIYGAGDGLISGSIYDNTSVVSLGMYGSGTWTLTGTNSYSGATTVSSGTLLVNGISSGAGAFTVGAAVLGGTGVIGAPVTLSAASTLSPGASAGTLTISNNLTLNANPLLRFELGASSDRVVVSGNLVLGGRLRITDGGGFGPGTYTLFDYGGTLSGTLPVVESAPTGYTYQVSTGAAGLVQLVVGVEGLTPYQWWQMQYFASTNNPDAAPAADPDRDRTPNDVEFAAGTNPTNGLSAFIIVAAQRSGNDLVVTWTAAGVRTNRLQVGTNLAAGNFVDIGAPIVLATPGDVVTNYVDTGAATNRAPRFYRVRLAP